MTPEQRATVGSFIWGIKREPLPTNQLELESALVSYFNKLLAAERDAALAEVADLRETLAVHAASIDYLDTKLAQLRTERQEETERMLAENARLRADALRYRWLRDTGDAATFTPLVRHWLMTAAKVDATIDAARKG